MIRGRRNKEEVKLGLNIMSNDPSMTGWGWVVLNTKGVVLASGAIKTSPTDKKLRMRKGDDRVRRITEINVALKKVVTDFNVSYLLSELPHGSQSAVAAVMVGITAGIMQTISDWTGIGLEWYSEGDAKMSVAGKRGKLSKDTMVELMDKKYESFTPCGIKWIDQAVADALAVHHVAMEQSETLQFINKMK